MTDSLSNTTRSAASHHAENSAETGALIFKGVRTHNLKNIDIRIKHGEFIVFTGPSGSGKSSLAFDTIYAEGRRQFLNSLSLKARQAVAYLPRPDIESAAGIQPVVCIDQKKTRSNSRSTVGTVSEIYDYLKLLFARVGVVKCSRCQRTINQSSPEEIESLLLNLPERTKVMILAPDNHHEPVRLKIAEIRKAGYVRVRIGGEIVDVDSVDVDDESIQQVDAVIDRIIIKDGVEDRIAESIAQALKKGDDELILMTFDAQANEWNEQVISTLFRCPQCDVDYEDVDVRTFNFNSPFGACPDCNGTGRQQRFSPEDLFFESHDSIQNLKVWSMLDDDVRDKRLLELLPLSQGLGIRMDNPVGEIEPSTLLKFFAGTPEQIGLATVLEKIWVTATTEKLARHLEQFRRTLPCETCQGSRLGEAGNHVFVGEKSIKEVIDLDLPRAASFFGQLTFDDPEKEAIAEPLIEKMLQRIQFLIDVGAHYLSLSRPTDTLSGGEHQRVRLATGIGSGLTGACYILDEPTIGLHPADNQKLIASIQRLKELGNTIIAVEHDPMLMLAADRIIDIGPQSGVRGGYIVADAAPSELQNSIESITGKYLSESRSFTIPKTEVAERTTLDLATTLELTGARLHNLKGDLLQIPLNRFVCVTGVSGSGKSSLIHGTLVPGLKSKLGLKGNPGPFEQLTGHESIDRVVEIDQSAIGRSPRSNAATFSGLFDEIRKIFAATRIAKQRGYIASRFSFNNKDGSCRDCGGLGHRRLEMSFMPDLFVVCESCEGRRFNLATLDATFKNLNISQVLNLSVDEALDVFKNLDRIATILRSLERTGLGYLKLGQPANSLSGGEAQRLKIATHLATPGSGSSFIVLDEPTTGLHFVDIQRLHDVIVGLVEKGHTVLVIEHNMELISRADHIIDLGNSGGPDGGKIVAAGSPGDLVENPSCSITPYL